jgi:hypothetical protein
MALGRSRRFGPAGLLLAALLLPALPLLAREDPAAPGHTVLRGAHYEVRLDLADEARAAEVLAVCEAAWGETCRLVGRDEPRPAEPLGVHVYATTAAYREAESARTGGRFAASNVFSHFETRTVHAALVPDGDPSVRVALGTSPFLLRQVGHEAAHVAVYTLVPNHRSHPDWLAEGIATAVEEGVSRARGWCPAQANESPFFATRMRRCQRLRARGLLPEPRAVFQDLLGHLPESDRYAVWWALYRFLVAAEPEGLREVLAAAFALGGGPGFAERLYEQVRGVWDDSALDRLNEGLRREVDAYDPRWEVAFHALEADGGTWRQMAFADSNAVAWRLPRPQGPHRVRGTLRIPASANPQGNVYVGEGAAGFFSVAFRLGAGVTFLEYRREGDQWLRHWHVDRDFAAMEPVAFEVLVEGREVRVRVDGEQVGAHEAARDLVGRFGVGTQARGGALWEGVHAER